MLLYGEKKWVLTQRKHCSTHVIAIGIARSRFLEIVHEPFFTHIYPMTPHFEGNHNIFLSDTILLEAK